MSLRSPAAGLLFALTLLASPSKAQTIFVDAVLLTGENDGSSWEDAYRGSSGLQKALNTVAPGQRIFVANGIYYPSQTMSRDASFIVPPGVEVYGGFFGGEMAPEGRPPSPLADTILSGDLLRDDSDGGYTDNSLHVVRALHAGPDTLLDRFVICGGNANGVSGQQDRGGGLLSLESSLTIRDCRFIENAASFGGAALAVDGTSPRIEGCAFATNSSSGLGGAALLLGARDTLFFRCSFQENEARQGGGLAVLESVGVRIIDSSFDANVATGELGGGALSVSDLSLLDVVNCTITDNSAMMTVPAGISVADQLSDVRVTNTILWKNTGRGGAQGSANQISLNADVTYSIVQGGRAGVGNLGSDPKFFSNTQFLTLASPAIDAADSEALPAFAQVGTPIVDRLVDLPSIPDTGVGSSRFLDIGSREFQLFTLSGTAGCAGQVNSTGVPALLTGSGSQDLSKNQVILAVGELPPNQAGLLLMSQTRAFVPVSDGVLCLGGTVVRFVDDDLSTGELGGVVFPLNVRELPGRLLFQVGETWNFQLWYRDLGGSSNFSNSLAYTWF